MEGCLTLKLIVDYSISKTFWTGSVRSPGNLPVRRFASPEENPGPLARPARRPTSHGNLTDVPIPKATKGVQKFLGVLIDDKLTFQAHAAKALASASWWTNQIRRLSGARHGIPAQFMRKLYLTVAVPRYAYAADIWWTSPHPSRTGNRQVGSVTITKRLASVQRRITIAILGAMRTTAGDTLDTHAFIPPVHLLLTKTVHRSAVRLASLPESHPLHPIVHRRRPRLAVHKTALAMHEIFARTKLKASSMETIQPIRFRPNHQHQFKTFIASSKANAMKEADTQKERHRYRVFSDGSGKDDEVGAAARLYIGGVHKGTLHYHLGTLAEHTVYEAEAVGLALALQLLLTTVKANDPPSRVFIGIDNQAVIKALDDFSPKPGHHILDHIHLLAHQLSSRHENGIDINVYWVPGHEGFTENEETDGEAKRAAEGRTSQARRLPEFLRKPLPHSTSAVKQNFASALQNQWRREWKKSPRFHRRLRHIDDSIPSKQYMQLILALPRNQAAILTQLRTEHTPLNHHLHRIHRADSPDCPHCGPGHTEHVRHYLFECPHYRGARTRLINTLRRKAFSLPYLLSSKYAMTPLMRYVKATRRFDSVLGTIAVD